MADRPRRARVKDMGDRDGRRSPSEGAFEAKTPTFHRRRHVRPPHANHQPPRLSAEAPAARSAPSLLARYLDACRAQGMAPAGVDATQEARLMRALLKEPDVAALREARVALAIDDGVRREAAKAARLIVDAAAVERARAHFAEAGARDAAARSADSRRARRRRTRRRAARSRKPRAGAAGSGAVEGIICCNARLIWTLMAKAARPPRSLAKPRKRQQVPSQECDTELEYSAAERVAQATLKTSVPHALFQIEPRAKADDSE